ncbi:jg16885 [Pararge aegeria aegeria]|uniref:Jg16885 protein n=1 Tax=Pararge aegeria aegeria TaxID=348720 RepID=A0A8S4SNS5_9NEOP|nr:jg16885 [Pararge aegeria aegeria]
MSTLLSQAMYRRNSDTEKPLEIDQESNPDPSRSNSPKNMKFYKQLDEEKTVLNQQKKSFCIDALLSKHIEPDQTIQEKMAQQKYLALIQNKNYITRYQNENYDTQIEQNTIERCQNRPSSTGFDSPRSGRSSPRSVSPGSDDGNRSECYSPPISPGVEGGSEEYDSYRPGIIPKPGLLQPPMVAQSALFNYPPPGLPMPQASAFHHPGDRVLHQMQLEWLARSGMFYHRIPELGGKYKLKLIKRYREVGSRKGNPEILRCEKRGSKVINTYEAFVGDILLLEEQLAFEFKGFCAPITSLASYNLLT